MRQVRQGPVITLIPQIREPAEMKGKSSKRHLFIANIQYSQYVEAIFEIPFPSRFSLHQAMTYDKQQQKTKMAPVEELLFW